LLEGHILAQLGGANGERRIVGQQRAAAGDDGGTPGPQALDVTAGRGAGDPLALAAGHGGTTVKTRRHLDAHIGPAAGMAADESNVQRPGLILEKAAVHGHSRCPQGVEPLAGGARIRIRHGRHYPLHAGFHQRLGAGAGTSAMMAGLEAHVGGGAGGPPAGGVDSVHFGVGFAGPCVPAFADHITAAHQHAADAGIGIGGIQSPLREFQGPGHEPGVVALVHGQRPLRMAHSLGSSGI